MTRLALPALCTLFFAVITPGQRTPWRQITIESEWAGLAPTQNVKLVIVSKNGAVFLNGQKINPARVDDLLASLTSEGVDTPTTNNLGITADWLERNVPTFRDGAPNQKVLFRKNFTDLTTVIGLLPSAFKFLRFDDYPKLKVIVTLKDGGRWVCASNSYYPFMLPWRVGRGVKVETTYNADISRALATLMPKGSLNRDRLDDQTLKEWLANAVMGRIKEQWDLLGVQNMAGDGLAELRRDFQVEHARINRYRSVDYGYVEESDAHEENLLATLRQSSLPPNVAEDVALLSHDGKIEGVSDLAERVRPYVTLALSVSWLSEYRAEHPEQKMYIRFVHDRSFSEKAMQNFAADMEKLGKESLAGEVAKVQNKAALVFLDYGSDWIILPDRRMILWRHYLPATFLKWSQADFTFSRCVDYNANDGGCVGMVVSADGVLQR